LAFHRAPRLLSTHGERRRLASESGQTQAEYVLVVAGIAIACIAAALILGAS